MIFFLGKKLVWQFEFILSKFWCRKLQISGMDSIYGIYTIYTIEPTNKRKLHTMAIQQTPPPKKKRKEKKKLKSQTKTS